MLYWWEWVHYGLTGLAVLIWIALGIAVSILYFVDRKQRLTEAAVDLELRAENRRMRDRVFALEAKNKALDRELKLLLDALKDPKGKLSP